MVIKRNDSDCVNVIWTSLFSSFDEIWESQMLFSRADGQEEVNTLFITKSIKENDWQARLFILQTFRRLLLNKCQDEFENRSKATEG